MMQKAIHYGQSGPRAAFPGGGGGAVLDHKVITTGADTVPDYLEGKILAGDNITLTVQGEPGGEQKLLIEAAAGGGAPSVGNQNVNKSVTGGGWGLTPFYFMPLDEAIYTGEGNWIKQYFGMPTADNSAIYFSKKGDQPGNRFEAKFHAIGKHGTLSGWCGMDYSEEGVILNSFTLYKDKAELSKPLVLGGPAEIAQHAMRFDQIKAGDKVSITEIVEGGIKKKVISANGTAFSDNALLLGANVYNCSSVGGFTNRYLAIKVSALGTGPVDKLSCYVFNTYGSRQLRMAIYDYTGAKLRETALTTLPAEQNNTVVLSIPELEIVSGNQYWIAVWGNGVDIPLFTSFSPYGSVFPAGMHAIQNESGSSLPPILNATYPNATTNLTAPINCFK